MITSVAPDLLPIYILTTVIEFMVVAAFARPDPFRVFCAVLLANIVSSGAAHVATTHLGVERDYVVLGIVLLEGFIISVVTKIEIMRAIALSLAANVAALITEIAIYSVYP